jgi:signal transduction histidine kinase
MTFVSGRRTRVFGEQPHLVRTHRQVFTIKKRRGAFVPLKMNVIAVNCDRTRIGQLASNLIGNALKHGAPDQPVRVRAKTEGGEFKLWVANAGDAIPAAATT